MTDSIENTLYGLFHLEGKLKEVPIGFIIDNNPFTRHYYTLNSEGQFVRNNSPIDRVVYIPLSVTEYKIKTDTEEKFPVYGLVLKNDLRPLYLVKAMMDGTFRYTALFKDHNGLCLAYYKNPFPQKSSFLFSQNRLKKVSNYSTRNIDWLDPRSIEKYLDSIVVGQEAAKKMASVVFSNYAVRKKTQDTDIPKDCLLLAGPTGSGKTLIVHLLAEAAGIPFSKVSLTGKSAEGYIGSRLSEVFKPICAVSNDDAPYGVVVLDEFDKIASNSEAFRNDFGQKLQKEMIGWLEGEKMVFHFDSGNNRSEKVLDTQNLLFVLTGAFVGTKEDLSLEQILKNRLENEDKVHNLPNTFSAQDLIEYGFKPELVGRITTRVRLHPLSITDKVKILFDSEKSILRGYLKLMKARGWELSIDEQVPEIIAQLAPPETGARELQTICGNLFFNLLYDPNQYGKNGRIALTSTLTEELLGISKTPDSDKVLTFEKKAK